MDEFNAREFQKKYKHTFMGVKFRKDLAPTVVFVQDVGLYEDGTYYVLLDTPKISRIKYKFSDFKILPCPDKQLIDFRGHTYLFTRTPARQWQKGICTANSNFKLVLDRFIQKVPKETTLKWQERNSLNSFDYTFNFINELFRESPYPLFKEAIKMLDMDVSQVSKTLSKTYFIALCPILKTPYILFRNTIPVAFYSNVRRST
jgi:hypothetical protein